VVKVKSINMAARDYDLSIEYDQPDMAYNGYYTKELYTDLYTQKTTVYQDKYEDQEFYGEMTEGNDELISN
jgi:hypothetical protein